MATEKLNSKVSESTAYYGFEPTRDPEDGMSPISRWMSHAFVYGDQSSSVVSIHVPPMTFVMRVALLIGAAFTGTTAVTVGDGDDVDGWIASGTITPTTAGDMAVDNDAALSEVGKLYEDGDTIDITFTGVATAGSGKVFIETVSYNEALTAT